MSAGENSAAGGSAARATVSSTALSVSLRPLVLLNVSDHHMRHLAMQAVRQEFPETNGGDLHPVGVHGHVFGVLLGTLEGRSADVQNSFELKMDDDGDGSFKIDVEHLNTRKEQYEKVFPDLDIVGFYSTGKELDDRVQEVFRSLADIEELPLVVVVDVAPRGEARGVPAKVYEAVESQGERSFTEVPHTVEATETERIGVHHVAHVSSTGQDTALTMLGSHVRSYEDAVRIMQEHIAAMVQHLDSVAAGSAPMDPGVLREIASVARSLPIVDSNDARQQLAEQYNEGLLTTLVASLTHGVAAMQDVLRKFQVVHERGSGQKRRTFA